MVQLAERLERAIKAAGIAITGVSIGDHANKATWRVAPVSQQAAAQAVIDAFNPDDPAHVSAERDADAQRRADDVLARALARVVWDELQKMQPKVGQTPLTLTQFRDQIRTQVRQLLT